MGLSMQPPSKEDTSPLRSMDAIPLTPRFRTIKQSLIAGRESAIEASWHRLLPALESEIETISSTGPSLFPTIDFADISDPERRHTFLARFRERGCAVIRNVVPPHVAASWKAETEAYMDANPRERAVMSAYDSHIRAIFWSPAQVRARAHPNVLAAQEFAMRAWHASDPSAQVVTSFPVAYVDRMRIGIPPYDDFYDIDLAHRPAVSGTDSSGSPILSFAEDGTHAFIDGGSVERWETDGYGGREGTYRAIWDGRWEDYDPWDSTARLNATCDLYNGAGSCSMFRMLQGWLPLNDLSPPPLRLCPSPKLSMAYLLLRPFFKLHCPSSSTTTDCSGEDLDRVATDPENWTLESPPSTVIEGAVPSYTQRLNANMHPNLHLPKSLIPVPDLASGDYLLWHSDMIYSPFPPEHTPPLSPVSPPSPKSPPPNLSLTLYLPACPLTQTNALYLARQRKSFLFGHPAPDFGSGFGEEFHLGRLSVRDVAKEGGTAGLRALGLVPWEEGVGEGDAWAGLSEGGRRVVALANGILFPERFEIT